MRFKQLADAEQYLNAIPTFKESGPEGARLGLEPMRRFCRAIGDPQEELDVIHVAGTNGKGTTCRFLSSVYQSAGYRCGMFISPHLQDFRERFTINGQWIPEQDVVKFFNRFQTLLERHQLTYFEICTALGFWWFHRRDVDLVAVETGLGGRWDATNIVYPLLSVITSISRDHQQLLGATIEEIAREKGGVIKPEIPVVVGKLGPEAKKVVKEIAGRRESPLHAAADLQPRFRDGRFELVEEGTPLSFKSGYAAPVNAGNIGIVRQVCRLLQERYPWSEEAFADGIRRVAERFPRTGCFERLHPRLNWYFDGAHNFEALRALTGTLSQYRPLDRWIVVFALMRDKIDPPLLNTFSEFKKKYYYSLDIKRAATFEEVNKYMDSLLSFPADLEYPADTLKQLESEFVIFTGSLYYYETVKKWIDTLY